MVNIKTCGVNGHHSHRAVESHQVCNTGTNPASCKVTTVSSLQQHRTSHLESGVNPTLKTAALLKILILPPTTTLLPDTTDYQGLNLAQGREQPHTSPARCKPRKATVRSRRILLPRIFMGNLHASTKIISFCIKSCAFSSSYDSEPKKSLICFSPVYIHLPQSALPTALPCFHPSHHDCIRNSPSVQQLGFHKANKHSD